MSDAGGRAASRRLARPAPALLAHPGHRRRRRPCRSMTAPALAAAARRGGGTRGPPWRRATRVSRTPRTHLFAWFDGQHPPAAEGASPPGRVAAVGFAAAVAAAQGGEGGGGGVGTGRRGMAGTRRMGQLGQGQGQEKKRTRGSRAKNTQDTPAGDAPSPGAARAPPRSSARAVTSPPSGRAGHRAAGKVPVVSAAASRRSAGWRGSDAPPPPRPRRRAGRGRAGRAPGGVPRLPAAGTPDGWVGAAAEGGGRRARAVAVGRARRRRRLGPRPCGPRGSARCRGGRRARPGAPCRGTCASQRRPRRAARRRGGGCRVGGDGGGGRHPTRRRGCHRHRRSCGGCPQQRGAPQRSAGMRESAPTARWGHPRGLRGGGRGGFNEEGQSLQRSCRSWRHAAYS